MSVAEMSYIPTIDLILHRRAYLSNATRNFIEAHRLVIRAVKPLVRLTFDLGLHQCPFLKNASSEASSEANYCRDLILHQRPYFRNASSEACGDTNHDLKPH